MKIITHKKRWKIRRFGGLVIYTLIQNKFISIKKI